MKHSLFLGGILCCTAILEEGQEPTRKEEFEIRTAYFNAFELVQVTGSKTVVRLVYKEIDSTFTMLNRCFTKRSLLRRTTDFVP